MPRYEATIVHSSISRARVVDCGPDLRRAKTIASREFGDGFRHHVITIYEADGPDQGLIVARRMIGRRQWRDVL